jgi:hypothetical protein
METLGQYWKRKKVVNAMFDEWLIKSDFVEDLRKFIELNYANAEISYPLTSHEATHFLNQIQEWSKKQGLRVRFSQKFNSCTAHFSLESD